MYPQAAQPPSPPAPLALAYDDLPPGSDLRRTFGEDGSVVITAPAGEPTPHELRAAAYSSGITAALLTTPFLVLALAVYSTTNGFGGIERSLRPLAAIAFAVFCGGVFLLAWRVLYTWRMGALTEARLQSTVLHAAPRRLLVETSGPLGDLSLDLPVESIDSLHPAGDGLLANMPVEVLPCLRLTTLGGTTYRLLVGHRDAELEWAAATLCQALGRPLAPFVR